MSENNTQNGTIEGRPKSLQDVDQPDSNHRTDFEDVSKAHAILSVIKTNIQAKEIVIDIKNTTEKDMVRINDDAVLPDTTTEIQAKEIHIETAMEKREGRANDVALKDIKSDIQAINIAINIQNTTEIDVAPVNDDAILPDVKTNIQSKEVVLDIKNEIEKCVNPENGDVVLSDMKANETIVDIEDSTKKYVVTANGVKDLENLDYLIYGHHEKQIKAPKFTWVMFETGSALPPDATPLDYDPQSRNGFVRLTLFIVLIMLLITAAFIISVMSIESLKIFFRTKGFFLALPAAIILIGLSYSLACSPCTRLFPCNIFLLFIAVICMSIISAYVSSRFSTRIVCYAFISTCAVVFVCFLLAFSGFDFTAYMLYIVVVAVAFGALGMVVYVGMLITGTYLKILHLVILIVGTLIQVVVLTMELQMILGGGAVELGETDYALGAFLLYTSIVDIFIKLVQILGILDSL